MANEAAQGFPAVILANSDADVGAGAPAAIVGFPAGTVGYSNVATDPYGQYNPGTLILARDPLGTGARLYVVSTNGSGLKVAVLIATGSVSPGGGGSITGTPLLYVLAPAALGLTNAFTDFTTAITSIPNTAPAMLMVLPGTYNVGANVTLRGSLSVIGMTAPNYGEKDTSGSTFGGVNINLNANSIVIDSGALSVGTYYNFSNVALNASGVVLANAGSQPLQFTNVTALGTTFINKTSTSGMLLGINDSYVHCPTVFTEPTSAGFRTSSIRARDSILGYLPGAPPTAILGILCSDLVADNCQLCGIDTVRETRITGGRIYVDDNTTPCITFRAQVPAILTLTGVNLRTSGLATTYVAAVVASTNVTVIGSTFQRVSTFQTSLIDPIFTVNSDQPLGGRLESFSSTDTVSPTTTQASIVSGSTMTLPSAYGVMEDQRLLVRNRSGSGSATLAVAGGTINGGATLAVGFGQYVQLAADRLNGNWIVIGGSASFVGPVTNADPDTLYVVGANTPGGLPYGLSTRQFTTITAAVAAAAAAGGGTVQILPGSYVESPVLAAGVDLVGVGETQQNVLIFGDVTVPSGAACGITNLNLVNVIVQANAIARIDNVIIGTQLLNTGAGNSYAFVSRTSIGAVIFNTGSGNGVTLSDKCEVGGSVLVAGNAELSNTTTGSPVVSPNTVILRDCRVDGVEALTISMYDSSAVTAEVLAGGSINAVGCNFVTLDIAATGTVSELRSCVVTSTITTVTAPLSMYSCRVAGAVVIDGAVNAYGSEFSSTFDCTGIAQMFDCYVGSTANFDSTTSLSGGWFAGVVDFASSATTVVGTRFGSNITTVGGTFTGLLIAGTVLHAGPASVIGGDYASTLTIDEKVTATIQNARVLTLAANGTVTVYNSTIQVVSAASADNDHSLTMVDSAVENSLTVSATAALFVLRNCALAGQVTANATVMTLADSRFESFISVTSPTLEISGIEVVGSATITKTGAGLVYVRSSHFLSFTTITASSATAYLFDVAVDDQLTLACNGAQLERVRVLGAGTFGTAGTFTCTDCTFSSTSNWNAGADSFTWYNCTFIGTCTSDNNRVFFRGCGFATGYLGTNTASADFLSCWVDSNASVNVTTAAMFATSCNFSGSLIIAADVTELNSCRVGGSASLNITGDIDIRSCDFYGTTTLGFDEAIFECTKFYQGATLTGTSAQMTLCYSTQQIAASGLGTLTMQDTTIITGATVPGTTCSSVTFSGFNNVSSASSGTAAVGTSLRSAKTTADVVAPGSLVYGPYLNRVTGSTPGDVVFLPASSTAYVNGYELYVFNVGSTSIDVTPDPADTLNGSTNPITLAGHEGALFFLDPGVGWLASR